MTAYDTKIMLRWYGVVTQSSAATTLSLMFNDFSWTTCVPVSCARINGSWNATCFVRCGMPTTGLMMAYIHSTVALMSKVAASVRQQ
jgi:hypothetical protein